MRCDLCFKDKSGLQPVLPRCAAKVCKGCFYEVDRIIGFLEHYGITVVGQQVFPPEKLKRRKPSKSKSRASKMETHTTTLKVV